MYRIRKKFRFEAAHQLTSAHSKACTDCIHGHSYVVEIFLTSYALNKDSMVLDFGVLKPIIDQIKGQWDHALILHRNVEKFYQPFRENNQKMIYLDENPTAEVMASLLYLFIKKYIPAEVHLEKVRVHETETGYAEYSE